MFHILERAMAMKAEIRRILRTYAFPVIILTICAFFLPLSVKILDVRFFRAIGISMQTEIINILWALFLIILMYLFTARPKGIDYEMTFPASRSRQLISRYITVLAYFVSIYLLILIFTKTNMLGMNFVVYFIFISSVFAITYLWLEYRNQFLISLALMVIIVFVFFKVVHSSPFDTKVISGSSWFNDNLSYLAIPLVFLVFYLFGCRKKFLTLFAAMAIFTLTYSCFHYLEHYSPYGKTISMSGYREFITLHKATADIKNIKYNIEAGDIEPHQINDQNLGFKCNFLDAQAEFVLDKKFDIIISIELIEHIENPFHFIREISKNGIFRLECIGAWIWVHEASPQKNQQTQSPDGRINQNNQAWNRSRNKLCRHCLAISFRRQ